MKSERSPRTQSCGTCGTANLTLVDSRLIVSALSDKPRKTEEERLRGLKFVKAIADAHGAVCSDQLVDLLPAIFGMYVSFLLLEIDLRAHRVMK